MDLSDDFWLGNIQQVVIVFNKLLDKRKLGPSVVLLLKFVCLYLSAHGSI